MYAPATKSAPQVVKVLRLPRDLHLLSSLRGRAIGELSDPVARPCAKQGLPSRVSHVGYDGSFLTKLPLITLVKRCF